MTIIGISQAIGPTIGGIILQYLSWRWIFFVNVPFGFLCAFLTLKFYRKEIMLDLITLPTLLPG